MKTIKVFKYRGLNIYIRHLFGESFEFLIPWKGEILENMIEFNKPAGRKYHKYKNEEMARVVDAMIAIAKQVIDDKLKGRLINKFNNFFNAKYTKGNKRAGIVSE